MTSRILAAAFALPFLTQPVLAAETLVQIVIDHSGVLHDEEDPQAKSGLNRYLDEFLHAVARDHRRDREDTRVVLISAVEPPRIIWSGSASAFYREALDSQAVGRVVAAQPNGCNNIPEALDEVTANLILEPAETSILHVITSGVHSGPDCAGLTQEGYVDLVENLDPDLLAALRNVGTRVDDATVHFLTSSMRRDIITSEAWEQTGINVFAQGQKGY